WKWDAGGETVGLLNAGVAMNRPKAVIGGLVFLTVLLGLLWLARAFQNRLTVENRSGQTVTLLELSIAGETIVFRELPDGGTVTAAFRIKTDDHFRVKGKLADG